MNLIQDADPDSYASRDGIEESAVRFSIPAESPEEQKG